MVHITINGPSKNQELDVLSTDVVDPILEQCSENLYDPEGSRYHEPAFVIGRDVPLNTGETFAECGIEHGDTLYHLLRLSRYIIIKNELESEFNTIVMPMSTCVGTVGNLIEILRGDRENRVLHVPGPLLCLRLGDEVLIESKTLDEYNIKNNDVIHLSTNCVMDIPIGVPVYANMERVLFKPGDTLADLKREVESMMPGFEYTAGIRPAYPVPLRSVVYKLNGSTFFMYLDLFCEEIEIFVTEYQRMENETPILNVVGRSIKSESCTFNDVHRIITMPKNYGERAPDYRFGRWGLRYFLDLVWMRTFASQIASVPLSSSTPLPLFFFPLCTWIFQSVQVSLSLTVEELVATFLEEEFVLEGVKRLAYHPQSDQVLMGPLHLHYDKFCSDDDESSLVLLTKPRLRPMLSIETGTSEGIIVQVAFENRICLFDVRSADTINTLQDEIERAIEVPFYLQKLMFHGKRILGNSTFRETGITDDSLLDLLPSDDFEILKFFPL